MAGQKFETRGGTVDFGKDYEYLMAAHHALRFAIDDSVLSYRLSTNNKDMGDFDDLVLEVEYSDGVRHLYALQLKHKAKGDKKLALNSFTGEKGDFSLRRYKAEYDKVHDIYLKKTDNFEAHFEHFHFLLYTNASLPNFVSYVNGAETETDNLKIGQKDNAICIVRHDQCVGRGLINVCDTLKTNYIFRFENIGDQKLEGKFLQQFFLYTKQKSAQDIEWAVGRMIFEHFPNCDPNVVPKILGYFKHWYRGDYGNYKLTKSDLKVKLAEFLVAPFVPQLVVGSWQDADSHNWNLLAEAMLEFDVTWLQDFDGSADQIWAVILGEFRLPLSKYPRSWTQPIPEFTTSRVVEMMQLPVAAQLESFTELSLKNLYLMLWQLNLMPLLLSVDNDQAWDVIQGAINLFKGEQRKKKFVLLTKQDRDLSETFSSLHNLGDLMSSPSYAEILDRFQVSLQGGRPMPLAALVEGDDLTQTITSSSLVKMASQVMTIGENASLKLPQPYVRRMVPKIILQTEVLRNVDDLFVVVCPNVDQIRAQIDVDAVHIQDYLTLRRRPHTKQYVPRQLQLSQWQKNQARFDAPTDKFLIVCTFISADEFDEICTLNPNICCHLVALTNDLLLEWRGSSKSVTKLRPFRIDSDESFADSALGYQFHGPINVLCADPGMGKSVTLDHFKVLWSAKNWVVKIDLNIYVKLFRQELDDVHLAHRLLNTDSPNLESATVRSYIKRKKVIVLWDGFDELPSSCTQRVIDIILEFQSRGYRQWIASRNSSKKHLEQVFDTMSLTLTQFSDDDQHQYVETRCLAKCKEYGYDVAEVHRMVVAMHQDMAVLFDCGYSDYSGVPLQIYMVTEIFQQDPRKYMDKTKGEVMTVVDIYREFIRGKFDRLYRKADAKAQNYHMERIQERYKKMVLGQYEVAALKATFDRVANSTDGCAELVEDIAESGDFLGMIIHINEDKKPTFAHRTYQEFLAASWLSKNYQDNKDLVQDLYDLEGLSNVRLMFDILVVEKSQPLVAILVKNYTLLKDSDGNLRDIRDQMGRTGLHLACSYGRRHPKLEQNEGKIMGLTGQVEEEDQNYLAIVDLLLDGGSDPLECDQFLEWNAFHYADRTLSLAVLNLLFKYKTYPVDQLTNYDVSSILHYCVIFNYDILFDNLKDLPYVEYGDIRDSSMLQMAVEAQRFSLVAKFLKLDNYKAVVNKVNCNQSTPVGSAAGLGHLATIELLVANGARLVGLPQPPLILAVHGHHFHVVEELIRKYSVEVDEVSVNGNTAFLTAGLTGQFQILKFLVENGADVNHVHNDFSALDYALHYDSMEAIKFLIDKKVDLNRKCLALGYTALHRVSEDNNIPVLKLLLESGADPTIKSNKGDVPLHTALLNGQEEAALVLLKFDGSVRDELNSNGCTPLVYAAMFGHHKAVHELLEMGADPDGPPSQHSPLNYAVDKESAACVRTLIAKGASVNSADSGGSLPLFYAIRKDDNTMMTLLLDNGAQVNAKSPEGVTPLHFAASNGRLEAARQLLTLGANIDAQDNDGDTALMMASKRKQPLMVEWLLKSGARIEQDQQGQLLYSAVAVKNPHLLEVLLQGGLNVNATNKDGDCALHAAAIWCEDCVDVLLKWKADLDVHSIQYQYTPLAYSIMFGNTSVTKKLVLAGASVNSVGDGQGPLHVAAGMGDLVSLVVLLEGGADVNASCLSKMDLRPLHFAASFDTSYSMTALSFLAGEDVPDNWRLSDNHQGCVTVLVEMGADVNAKCHNGVTPLHLACARSRLDIVPTLIDLGAEVNTVTDTKVAPLHAASWIGSIQHVRLLVEKGARVNALDDFGRTPLSYAAEIGNDEILDYLISMGGDVNFEEDPNLSCTPLLMAVAKGNISSIVKLLGSGAAPHQFGHVDESLLLLGAPNLMDSLQTLKLNTTESKLSISKVLSERSSLILESWRNPGNKDEMNSLMVACKYGNLAVVQLLIEHGADVNAANSLGWTALNIARHYKRQNVVDYLVNIVNLDNEVPLERGGEAAPLQPQASYTASTLLHAAVASSQLELLDLVLNFGTAVDNSTVLVAIRCNSLDMVRRLHQHGAILNSDLLQAAIDVDSVPILDYLFNNTEDKSLDSLFLYACSTKHVQIVQYFIEHGADINSTNSQGCPVISIACYKGYPEVVTYLLENGADVNKPNSAGSTAIFYAIGSKNWEVIQLVVDCGASIQVQDIHGDTPLHHAVWTSPEIVTLLIAKGASIDQRNGLGRAPLHLAAAAASLESVKYLIDAGADVHQVDNCNRTTLYEACTKECPGLVEFFVDLGVEIDAANDNGNTALFAAAANGLTSVVRYLRSKGARIQVVDHQGDTPMHDAALNGHLEVVKYLVEMGGDVNWRNNNGKTPLDLASDEEVVRYLSGVGRES